MTKKEVLEFLNGYRKAMWAVMACEDECRLEEADEERRQAAAARLAAAKEQAQTSRARIERAADLFVDKRYSVVIRIRYIHLTRAASKKRYQLRKWRDIAGIVHFGMSTVKRVHTEAIRLLMNYETL